MLRLGVRNAARSTFFTKLLSEKGMRFNKPVVVFFTLSLLLRFKEPFGTQFHTFSPQFTPLPFRDAEQLVYFFA